MNKTNDNITKTAVPSTPWWQRVWHLYYDGFRSMTIGKTLWLIILIKLFVIFVVLKLFFFPNILATRYDNDEDRANAVLENLTNKNNYRHE